MVDTKAKGYDHVVDGKLVGGMRTVMYGGALTFNRRAFRVPSHWAGQMAVIMNEDETGDVVLVTVTGRAPRRVVATGHGFVHPVDALKRPPAPSGLPDKFSGEQSD